MIPPLIGFFSKLLVLQSAVQSGYTFLSFIGILVSVISASYYLKIIKTFFFFSESNSNEDSKEVDANLEFNLSEVNITNEKLSNLHSFLISTLTLSILFFIFKPSLILNTTQLLSISLFNQ